MEQKVSDDAAALEQSLAEKGVKYLMASFVDMHGVSKTKIVPLSHINQMLQGSELYTGAALDGVPQDVSDEEVATHPDPDSAAVLPWQPEMAWFASDLWCEANRSSLLARHSQAPARSRARISATPLQLGIETEFFVLKDADGGACEPLSPLPTSRQARLRPTRPLDNLA